MEHSLHLASHHFVKALNNGLAGNDNEDIDVSGGIREIETSGRDEEAAEEVNAEDFLPGDVLGKVLALIGLVSGVFLIAKLPVLSVCMQIRKSPQARHFFLQQCKRENLPEHRLKGWVRTRWGSLYDLVNDVDSRRAVSLFRFKLN